MAQVQCPNCGGYRVTGKTLSDKKTLAREYRNSFWSNPLSWIVMIGGVIVIVATMAAGEAYICLFLISIIIWIGLVFFLRSIHMQQAERIAATATSYNCELCGYSWVQRIGDPKPEVTVRPDLIAKGEQRLVEEREKKKREEEQRLRDSWYMEQMKRKK